MGLKRGDDPLSSKYRPQFPFTQLRYRVNFREDQRSVSRDNREFFIALIREAEDAAERNDFSSEYLSMVL